MRYKLAYDIDLDKALEKIPERDVKSIKEKIEALAVDPRAHGQTERENSNAKGAIIDKMAGDRDGIMSWKCCFVTHIR